MKNYINVLIFSLVSTSIVSSVSFSLDDEPSPQEELSLSRLPAYDQLPLEIWSNIISWISTEPSFYVNLSLVSHGMNRVAKNIFRETSYVFLIKCPKSSAQYQETLQQNHGWQFPNVSIKTNNQNFKPNFSLGSSLLSNNTTMTFLDLRNNYIGQGGVSALSAALQNNSTLKSLNLADNKIAKKGVRLFSTVLLYNTTLKILDLSSDDIGDEGAVALSMALQGNTTLTSLNLWNNDIGNEGAVALSAALQKNTTLTYLDLRDNRIGNDGSRALSTALEKNTHVKVVGFINCLTW